LAADRRPFVIEIILEETMRALRFVNVAILSALVASSAALYAKDEKQQPEDKPRQEEPKRQEAPKQAQEPKREEQSHPAARQDEMKAPRQEQANPPKEERQEPKQEQKKEENRRGREMTPGQPQGHAGVARKSAHIPEEKFHAQFGREHHFAVRRPVVVEGSPGFFYGGYSFVLVDSWPAEWTYDDDCYVDYIDGEYFLFNVRHPGVRIALMVVE
jgi:hypothetical protein